MTEIPFHHRWSIGRHLLGGITRANWIRLCRENEIDQIFRGRAALLGLLSHFNSFAAQKENLRFGASIDRTAIAEDPVFIIGHWRSGTTYLHQLLSLDPRFGFVTTLQAIHPETSFVLAPLLGRRELQRRPMDNIRQGPHTAQEDEFAIATRSLCSPFLGYVFPRRAEHYDRFLTFDEAAEPEIAAWKAALLHTVRKASFAAGGRRLILKSPPHTARIRLLLELFPRAKFVYLHRHPVDVFQSTLELNNTLAWHSYLQKPPERADLIDSALRRYRILHEAFLRDEPLIPAGNLAALSYRDLTERPLASVSGLYAKLGLASFDFFSARLGTHLAEQTKHVPKARAPLSADLVRKLRQIAGTSFARWFYD